MSCVTPNIIPIHAHASVIHDAKGAVSGWVAFVTILPEP
jgi:hypothetical protein